MDKAKRRLVLGILGAVFCVASVCAFFAALIYGLAIIFNPLIGFLLGGIIFLAIGSVCAYLCLRPFVSSAEEIGKVEEAAADALADLPFDAVEAMIRKRPLASVGLALLAGYSAASDPHRSMNHMQGWLMRMI